MRVGRRVQSILIFPHPPPSLPSPAAFPMLDNSGDWQGGMVGSHCIFWGTDLAWSGGVGGRGVGKEWMGRPHDACCAQAHACVTQGAFLLYVWRWEIWYLGG
jgi:hypothetical protein